MMNNYHALNPLGHNDNPGELSNNPRQQMNHRPKSTRDDNNRQRLPRDANPVITGTSTNCTLRAAMPRIKYQNPMAYLFLAYLATLVL